MKQKYFLLFLLLTGLKSFSQTDSFLTPTCIGTTTNPQNRFYQPQVGDFDGDTDKDIIVLDESGVFRLFTNDGSNNFTQTTILSGLTWSSLISKDLDNDGDIDIVSSAGKIFINNGSAVFTELPGTYFTTTGSIGAFRVADFNGDTKQDILWLNATSNSTTVNQIWFNNGTTGNASFVLGTEIQNLNGYTNLGSVVGDIDNDGDIDLVFCQQGGWNGRVFTNNGSGVFTNTQNLPTYTGEGFLADWDKDGDLDFLAYDYYNNWGLRLWKNDGTGTFGPVSTNSLITMPSVGAVDKIIDLNGDTWLDVVLRNGSGARYYLNSGCQLTLATQVLSNSYNGIAISDFNNDGKPDFFNAARDGQSCININDLNVQSYVAITAPVVSTQVNYFVGQSASPLVATGNNILWYTGSTGGTGSTTAPTPNTASVGTTSYWVSNTNTNGCESERIEVVVTVSQPATHLNFDGTNDYVANTTPFTNFTNQITVEFWVNRNGNITTGSGIGQSGNTDSMTSNVWLIHGNSNNTFTFYVNQAGAWRDSGASSVIPLNTWTHVAAVADANGVRIYVNGVLSNSTTNGITSSILSNPTAQMHIGKDVRFAAGTGRNFNGSFDEVRIWNSARTAEQIFGSKNCELQGTENGLVSYYNFNQGIDQSDNTSITTLTASTGSNATLNGFALNGSTSNWLAGSPVTTGSVIPSVATATTPVIYNQGDTASALLATTGTNGTGLMWYTSATGGTGSTMAPTPSTTTAGSTSYWVSSTNANGCESARIEIVVTVNANATNLNFDGVNDNVAIPASAINNLNQGTIEVWVYPTASVLDNQTICAKQSNFENTYAFLSIGGASAANGRAYYQSTNSASIQSNATIIPNQWTHIAVAFTSTQAKIYINGVLDNTVTGSFSLPNDTSVTATTIGAILGDGNGQYFTGSIDEFRVWNVALTDADITATMNCEAQMQPELVTYYKFNQGFDNSDNAPIMTLTDELGNSNGTLNGFALTGVGSNWKAGSSVTTGNTCATLSNSYFETTSNFKVYPNPSKGIFNVNTEEVLVIEIYDIVGKLVKTSKIEIGTSSIDISNLNSGVYLLKTINSENKSQVFKLIKE